MKKTRCPNCNSAVNLSSKYCGKCGCEIKRDLTSLASSETKIEKSYNRITLICVIVAIAILIICICASTIVTHISEKNFNESIVSFSSESEMNRIMAGVWKKELSNSYQELCFNEDAGVKVWTNHFNNTVGDYDFKWLSGWSFKYEESQIKVDVLYKTYIFYGLPSKATYVVRKVDSTYYLTNIDNHDDEYVKVSNDTDKGMDYYNAVGKAKGPVYDYCSTLKEKHSSISSIDFNNAYTVENGTYVLEYRVKYNDYSIRYGQIVVVNNNGQYSISGGLKYNN